MLDERHQATPDAAVVAGDEGLRRWSQAFRRDGIVTLTDMIAEETRRAVRDEAEALLSKFAERRDLHLATTDYTPRSMSVVPSESIAEHSQLISSLYGAAEFTGPLEAIAGERLHRCPKLDEEYLITRHEKAGDTHGWHWGDFSFALIWVLQAPEMEDGGLLQCVPHTRWDKAAPRIFEHLCENPIRTYAFRSLDVYFLRTDTTLHRTIPLRREVTRIILNMTWASAADLARNYDHDDRWWDDADVSAAAPVDAGIAPTDG